MENFIIEGTAKTPRIYMDPFDGIIELEGRSNPENAREFFHPVVEWLEEYISHPADRTSLTINLEHFNTSSSKYLMEILRRIRVLADEDHPFNITWIYEDDDLEMLDTAEAYEMMTGLIFEKVAVPEGGGK